ncbi:MAG: plastocyanin/azurin family copper-binding protein [Gemmatimonadales bacterium]
MSVRYSFVLAFVAACGSGSTSSSPTPPPAPPPPPPAAGPVVNVSMTDNGGGAPYVFSPAPLTISVGTSVRWTNNGTAPHTSTSDASPPTWNSGVVNPAGTTSCPSPPDPYYPCTPGSTPPGTYTRTFTAAGTYRYHCANHSLQGMTGTITVNP